jgi:hypothetical protein
MALCAGILACCFPAAVAAESITGVVRNQTQGRPAAGDVVLLLGAGQGGHEEEAHAKTNSQGAFSLELRHPEKPYLVRVIHQGVNYDRQVSAGNAISIDVADAAAKVQGITGNIEIIRAGTNGNMLHVSEMVEIKNLSNPPVTQASERTFEVYLPGDAKIDSVMAAGPENIGAMISATLVRGEPGRYSVNFPLRPGSTKFAFNYDVPYDGRTTFRTKNMYPLQQLAVMIPPTMTFTSRSPAFQILSVGNNRYKVEAAEQVKAGEGPEFEISGVGALPSTQAQPHSLPRAPAGSVAGPSAPVQGSANTRAPSAKALGSVSAAQLPTPSSRLQWGALAAGALVILAAGMILFWLRQRPLTNKVATAVQGTKQSEETQTTLVEALKEGLFQLETDRVEGSIPEEEYASAKQALESTIQWALTRTAARRETARQELSRDVSRPSAA